MSVPASALYGAILAILTILLAANVSRHRGRVDALYGHKDDEGLEAAIRAHANATEYIPIGLLLLLIAELGGANTTSMHGLGGSLLIGRVASAHGITTRTRPTRAIGALVTWLAVLGAAAYALLLRFK